MVKQWRGESRESKEVLYRVLAILYRYSEEIAVLEHPRSIERRSVDLAVKLRDGRKVLVKVAYDIDNIPRSELQELLALSITLNIPPLIVALTKSGEPLLEGVVYEKSGIKAISPETLDDVLSGRELAYIKMEKDSFILNVDGEVMRKKRLERNLSLGDLALMVGVSRRTIYEYEKGTMEPSIEKAEKLIKILGEDIAKPIDIFSLNKLRPLKKPSQYDTVVERSIGDILRERGYRVAHVKRTVVDIAAKKDEKDVAILVEHPGKSSSLADKAYYLTKLANTIGIEEKYIVVETRKAETLLRKEGYETIKMEELVKIILRGRECKEERVQDRSS